MKILYTQKKSTSSIHKRIFFAFESLLVAFVMCFFGMIFVKQKIDELENRYESVTPTQREAVKDAIELIIPLKENENG